MEVLSREEVRAAVERKGGHRRVPIHRLKWYNSETAENYGEELRILSSKYPDDVISGGYNQPDWKSLSRETVQEDGGIDAHMIISDYQRIDDVAEKIRQFGQGLDMSDAGKRRQENTDRYCLGYTWFALYERLWMLRGMENSLMDFYNHPQGVKKLMQAITDFHVSAIRAYGELGYDGITISDDLGTQNSTMFSRDIFLEFYKPLYGEIFAAAQDYDMHTWLHTCGHVTQFLGDFIDVGLDVIHPIQHSTFPGGVSAMDPVAVVQEFGGRITFWTGVDVQYLLPLGTTDEVRQGMRELIDTFDGPDGGLVIAAGNAIMPETPIENIEACFDESFRYGTVKRKG